jgi:hypothetical protein
VYSLHIHRRHQRPRCEQELESGCERALWPQHVQSMVSGPLCSGPSPAASRASHGFCGPERGIGGKGGTDMATSGYSLDLAYSYETSFGTVHSGTVGESVASASPGMLTSTQS